MAGIGPESSPNLTTTAPRPSAVASGCMVNAGVGYTELAQASGLSYWSVLRIRHGKTPRQRGSTIEALARALEVDAGWLRDG